MANWSEVLSEIKRIENFGKQAYDITRRRSLNVLHKKTKRNIIAYYSGFLSKPYVYHGLDINDEDKNGFMMTVNKMDKKLGLDLILHTPGGSIVATQSIVDYLHKMFNKDIRVIVPQIAMSAGTMIACSSKQIWLSKHSNLGPIDPHLDNKPAHGVIEEFERACNDVKDNPHKVPIWQSIISQYKPTFLSQCENAIDMSDDFVTKQLKNVMFSGQKKAKEKAEKIVKKLTDYSGNKSHSRHIHFEECKKMGLKVKRLENDQELQDLVLTAHHCFMHTIMNTPCYKIIENHLGTALVRNVAKQQAN